MKTQLKPDQGWMSLREAADQIYKENGDKMRVKFCANEYELTTEQHDDVRWYAGFIDEEAAALFMSTSGEGLKYYSLIIDPLLKTYIVKCSANRATEIVDINEKLITIL